MSESLKSTHVRLCPEAHRVLSQLADLEQKDNAEVLRIIAEEVLLGRVHTLMLAADRYKSLGFEGSVRDSRGTAGHEQRKHLIDDLKRELFEVIKKELIHDVSRGGALSRALRP